MPSINRIILIQPKSRLSVRIHGKIAVMSNTLVTVAASVPPQVPEVIIIDENDPGRSIPWHLMDPSCTLVGITCLTPTANAAYSLADRVRARGVPVVLGGIHMVGLHYAKMLEEASRHSDAVVVGEVEGLWEEILADLEQEDLKPVYRLGHRHLPDLSCLKMARYDLANRDAYWMWPVLEYSRGCPRACTFCIATAGFGARVRYRPVADVVRDIRWLKARGARAVFFTDNNIGHDEGALADLCRALKREDIKWMSQCHAEITHNRPLLKLMRDSGCYGMLVGFETMDLDPGVSHKNDTVDVRRAVAAFHDFDILLIGCFVFGLPGQADADREEVVQFMLDEIDMPQLSIITPYPGTKNWNAGDKDLILPGATWDDFTITKMVYDHPDGPESLAAKYDCAMQRIYSRRQIARRCARIIRRHGPYAAWVAYLVNSVYRELAKFRYRPSLETWPYAPERALAGNPA